MELFVQYTSFCTHDYHDGREYGDWEKTYDFGVEGVVASSRGRWSGLAHDEELFNVGFTAVPGERVHVLWMQYGTGDSFGHSSGEGEIIWVFKDEHVARQAQRHLQENSEDFMLSFTDDAGNTIKFSNPGSGYFESVEHITVSSFELAP